MWIDVLTLFPEACEVFFSASMIGRARRAGCVTIRCHDIREYSKDPHQKVDDRPFGGGPGMVMMCQPVFDAVEAVEAQTGPDKEELCRPQRILLTPSGERLTQRIVEELSKLPRLLLVAGHYEGFDERIRLGLKAREISIGDFVLSGGEAAAMAVVDAVVRLVPGVLGDPASLTEESFSACADDGNVHLEYPQYTRPREFRGMDVPEVLLGGDHEKIGAWRRDEAKARTRERRPDLLTEGMKALRHEGTK